MSFVRFGGRSHHSQGKRPVARPKKKTAGAPQREWVSTVNDLTVHKPTPEELRYRHESHKSHNRVVAQWELKQKAMRRQLRVPGSPAPLDHASASIIREVFSDQLLLQDVLSRSDRAMAVVKDLFGDAPHRQTGHPSVTMAPDCDSDSVLPVVQRPDPPTPLALLSQSIMDQQALNELDGADEYYSEEEAPAASSVSVVHRANLRKMKARTPGRRTQRQRVQPSFRHQGIRDGVPVTPCRSGRAPNPAALNATVAVQRVRSRQNQSEEHSEDLNSLVTKVLNSEPTANQPVGNSACATASRTSNLRGPEASGFDSSSLSALNGNQSSLGLLQTMLGQVETELDSLTAKESDTEPAITLDPQPPRAQGLTGFSVALVSTLGRLVRLLKQREDEAKREAQERRRLEQELREQRGLIDALTAETLTLREESSAMQAGLQQRTAELEQMLDTVVLALGGLELLGAPRDDRTQHSEIATDCQHGPPFPERDTEQTEVPIAPAVLLSPPRQIYNQQHSPVFQPVPLHQDLPFPADTMRSCEDVRPLSSAPSFSSLPLPGDNMSFDPLRSQPSQEALLAQIAHLTQQNNMIRTQLNQANVGSSGIRGSPNSNHSTGRVTPQSVGEIRLAPSSTGRVTPQSVGEFRSAPNSTGRVTPQSAGQVRSARSSTGRVTPQNVGEVHSASSSIGRRTPQQVQTAHGEPPTEQVSVHEAPSMSSVEQRLLELNRQSAAARGRLLELIEQQKHSSTSARVSPSVSPIPPSAFSPPAAAGGRSPDAYMLLPAQDSLSRASGGGRRSAGSERASPRPEDEPRGNRAQQIDQREGWFALSTHMR